MRFFAPVLIVLLFSAAAWGQSSTIMVGDEKRTIAWFELVGKTVTCEGLAWGAMAKGLGQYVIFPNNPSFSGRVYLKNFDALEAKANGRLVYLKGVLRKDKAHKGGIIDGVPVQGYSDDFTYYYLDVTHWKLIDRLTNPQLLPAKADPP